MHCVCCVRCSNPPSDESTLTVIEWRIYDSTEGGLEWTGRSLLDTCTNINGRNEYKDNRNVLVETARSLESSACSVNGKVGLRLERISPFALLHIDNIKDTIWMGWSVLNDSSGLAMVFYDTSRVRAMSYSSIHRMYIKIQIRTQRYSAGKEVYRDSVMFDPQHVIAAVYQRIPVCGGDEAPSDSRRK